MRRRAHEQNSAYGLTTAPHRPYRVPALTAPLRPSGKKPYPARWEDVAELRVFRTTPTEWEKLIQWRGEMRRRGWRLLRVTSEDQEMVAVFGRTRGDRKLSEGG